MKLTKSIERAIIVRLKPNNSDREIAKKMAYMREHFDLSNYIGYNRLIADLDDLVECEVCNELEQSEHMNEEIGCRSCKRDYTR